MIVEAKIPIKPHLKKYMLKRYGSDEPVLLTKKSKSVIGKFLIQSFGRHDNKPKKIRKFTDTLNIIFDHEYDIVLSEGNIYDFNDLFEDIYRKDLALFISFDKFFNPYHEKKRMIELFNDKYKISEDDISLETLLKYFQRHKEDTEIFDFEQIKKVS